MKRTVGYMERKQNESLLMVLKTMRTFHGKLDEGRLGYIYNKPSSPCAWTTGVEFCVQRGDTENISNIYPLYLAHTCG